MITSMSSMFSKHR